jgi:FkbM family methyltransferase
MHEFYGWDFMSSNFGDWIIEFALPRIPIVHAGAHFAEERFDYSTLQCEPVYWIEALASNFDKCQEFLIGFEDQHAIQAAVSDTPGQKVTLYEAGVESSSSSILKPHLISASHPEVGVHSKSIVTTTTLDLLLAEGKLGSHEAYGLVMDLQGAEKLALIGATSLLRNVVFIVSEVSTRELYKRSVSFKQLRNFLFDANFDLLAYDLNRTTGWGEALFVSRAYKDLALSEHIELKAHISGAFSPGTLIRTILTTLQVSNRITSKFKR